MNQKISFFLLCTFFNKGKRYTGHSEWLKIGAIWKILGGKQYTGSYLLLWTRKYFFFSCVPFSKKVKGIQGTQNGLKLGLFEKYLVINSIQDPICYCEPEFLARVAKALKVIFFPWGFSQNLFDFLDFLIC